METAEIFRVTVNSLIAVFSCHLSLIKDKKTKAYASKETEEAATIREKEQFSTDVVCGRNSALNCSADSLVLENLWLLVRCLLQ